MNGQQRSNNPYKDYGKLNIVKSIIELKDYREYKRILLVKPFINVYMGYLGEEFFGYRVPDLDPDEKDEDRKKRNRDLNFMEPEQAVDYYFENFNLIFQNSALEYAAFNCKKEYKPYIVALKFKLEKGFNNDSKTKT